MQPALGKDASKQFLIASLLLPLRHLTYKGAKGRLQSLSFHVVRESLKWKAKDCDAVEVLHGAAPELLAVHHMLACMGEGEGEGGEEVRVRLGRAIRQLKELWRAGGQGRLVGAGQGVYGCMGGWVGGWVGRCFSRGGMYTWEWIQAFNQRAHHDPHTHTYTHSRTLTHTQAHIPSTCRLRPRLSPTLPRSRTPCT
jgi:hypothetical protein